MDRTERTGNFQHAGDLTGIAAGQRQEWRSRRATAQILQQFNAVAIGHEDVADHQRDPGPFQLLHRLTPMIGMDDPVTLPAQQFNQAAPQDYIVVHEENV